MTIWLKPQSTIQQGGATSDCNMNKKISKNEFDSSRNANFNMQLHGVSLQKEKLEMNLTESGGIRELTIEEIDIVSGGDGEGIMIGGIAGGIGGAVGGGTVGGYIGGAIGAIGGPAGFAAGVVIGSYIGRRYGSIIGGSVGAYFGRQIEVTLRRAV